MAMTFPINQGQDLYRVFMIYPQPIANRGNVIFMGSLYITKGVQNGWKSSDKHELQTNPKFM